ncbi:carbohydrate ABC transporter permease [Microbacterium murale]|uniref:Raffinose/stachyose/melibiose transport system permease protein n=1 Tax=Microbacterium murale TaxID=1081040 RepID=A0ABU0P723_9MICO|nr:sugar ABC transporter permease [Microbacterium murale]MDQ0643128.1 raffinose/stachyose/melibiose transport system permease protein [Microbacterium murale]
MTLVDIEGSTDSDVVTGSAARQADGSRRRFVGVAQSRSLLVLAIPALIFYGFAVLVPSIRGAVLAFTNWDGLSRNYDFIGLDNFVRIFTSQSSLDALRMTLIFAIAVTILQNGIGLLLALGVNSGLKSQNFLRVLFFAPVVITPVVVAYLWKFLLTPNGAVNTVLDAVGLGALAPSWLGDPFWAAASVVMMIVWQHAGYSMVIYIAGLQSIPQEINEAAAVDGAGSWRRFWSVTWPLLAPATAINIMLTIIGGLKMFTEVFVLTAGGPGGSTETMSTLLYKSAFQFNEFGYGIALALVLAIVVVFFSVAQQRMSRKGS